MTNRRNGLLLQLRCEKSRLSYQDGMWLLMEISLFAGERNSKPNQINKQTETTTAKKVHSEQQKKKSAKR